MIKTVIFDIDNTLYDFDRANLCGMEAVQEYCQTVFGLEGETFRDYYQKAWKLEAGRVGTDTASIHNRLIRFQCMMELLGQPVFPHARSLCRKYWDTILDKITPFSGTVKLFQNLKAKNIRIGIGTDMTAYVQYRKLEVLGLSPYIDMVITSEEAGVEKPHPKFFGLCVEKAGCPAEECAFIGDSLEKDVEGAIASGLHGIWYTMGKEPEQDMPFPVISSFEDCKYFTEL